jgi:hypothetical protein
MLRSEEALSRGAAGCFCTGWSVGASQRGGACDRLIESRGRQRSRGGAESFR